MKTRAQPSSPGTGRFFGVDPLAEDFAKWSPYVYSMNSPMIYVDPDGRSAVPPIALRASRAILTRDVVITALKYAIGAEAAAIVYDAMNTPISDLISPSVVVQGTDIVLPKLPSLSPGEGWEWKGKGEVGSDQGAWYNPSTKESLKPDLEHKQPVGPHWDYVDPQKVHWRVDPKTGQRTPKKEEKDIPKETTGTEES